MGPFLREEYPLARAQFQQERTSWIQWLSGHQKPEQRSRGGGEWKRAKRRQKQVGVRPYSEAEAILLTRASTLGGTSAAVGDELEPADIWALSFENRMRVAVGWTVQLRKM